MAVVCLWLMLIVEAKGSNLRFDALSVADGLPNSTIWDMAQDDSGRIWFATSRGLSRYDGYEFRNYFSSESEPDSLSDDYVRAIHVDGQGRLWAGTFNGGLNQYQQGKFVRFAHDETLPDSIGSNRIFAITSNSQGLWVATDQGLSFKSARSGSFRRFDLSALYGGAEFNVVNCVYVMDDGSVLAGTNGGLIVFDDSGNSHRKIEISFPDERLRIRSLLQLGNRIIIGTNVDLYVYEQETQELSVLSPEFRNAVVLDLVDVDGEIWVGSYKQGISRIRQDGSVTGYPHSRQEQGTPSEDISLSLLADGYGNLWSGTFDSGVNRTFLPAENFRDYGAGLDVRECGMEGNIRSVFESGNGDLWVSSDEKYIRYNRQTQSCTALESPNVAYSKNYSFRVHQTFADSQNQLWAATTLGLFKIDTVQNKLINVAIDSSYPIALSIFEYAPDKLILGTNSGAYFVDSETLKVKKVKALPGNGPDMSNAYVRSIQAYGDLILFATDKGLARLQNQVIVPHLHDESRGLLQNHIYALLTSSDHFFIALADGSIYKFAHDGSLHEQYALKTRGNQTYPLDVLHDRLNDHLWVSSSNGFFRIDLTSGDTKRFSRREGLRSEVFIQGAAFRAADGKMYFGGPAGFIAFYPHKIRPSRVPPKVVMTKLTRFNNEVVAGQDYDGFSIDNPIEHLENLQLTHKDYVIGLEFAGVHHAFSSGNQYAFMMQGLHDEWNYTDAGNRSETFTNLAPGEYVFRVKAANKDGVWSQGSDNIALNIKVHPAPWMSWWAFSLYALAFVAGLLAFIRYRTRAAIRQAYMLEQEVAERTTEIASQKQIIESLLDRKNELFANISHEFRTPLTLILGPLEKELNAMHSPDSMDHLQMISRNANRLLGMVEQVLMLTELKSEQPVEKVVYAVKPAIEQIVASFQALAGNKDIDLILEPPSDCNVLVSQDALEVMLGNLLSNAIKYTPPGGQIKVLLNDDKDHIKITVADSGVGFADALKGKVFERFSRLNKTSDIAGTGIGLSIVKELVDANEGEILVESREGAGTTFTLILPKTDQRTEPGQPQLDAISHLTSVEVAGESLETIETDHAIETSGTILIIEDNADMQCYIKSTLEPDYHCLTADRGELGVELATREVPDLVICDVMMPGMDGYEVARKLREDLRTSHIPIILLTAKGDKESRIQGWNENIDDYMTKPFDELELKSRIANILAIRNILRRQSSIRVQSGRLRDIPSITQQDQKFLDRFETVIARHYRDPVFLRPKMAFEMAVSERQLQRKLKALIDLNPMDYLRDYRLKKSIDLLLEGKQVALVSDECGFSAPSHYTRCFKAKYNLTPKQYQKNKTQFG